MQKEEEKQKEAVRRKGKDAVVCLFGGKGR